MLLSQVDVSARSSTAQVLTLSLAKDSRLREIPPLLLELISFSEALTVDGGWHRFDRLSTGTIDESVRKGKTYHVGNSLTDDGMWTSDHRPVFCDIKLYG